MKRFLSLTARNIKLYFSDKGMFLTSLITPLILLVLFASFLGNVYKNSFIDMIPEGLKVSETLINNLVSGQLISSLLAVSCVTVAFCSNLMMVQDKVNGARSDLSITPINPKILSLSYFLSSFVSTFIINIFALIICLIYVSISGWYLSLTSIMLMILNIFLLTLFGVALSSIINYNLSTQGQISTVGSMVSSGYGFLCGAYMPISSFGLGLQRFLSFLPGTYGTVLLKNSTLNDAFSKFKGILPDDAIATMKQSIDLKISFFGNNVSIPIMYIILISSIIALMGIYVLQNILKKD